MARYRIVEKHDIDKIYYIIEKKNLFGWWYIASIAEAYDLADITMEFPTVKQAEQYIQDLHPYRRIVKEITI